MQVEKRPNNCIEFAPFQGAGPRKELLCPAVHAGRYASKPPCVLCLCN